MEGGGAASIGSRRREQRSLQAEGVGAASSREPEEGAVTAGGGGAQLQVGSSRREQTSLQVEGWVDTGNGQSLKR